jgi:Ca2+-binding EF-hand superfamily protein
MTKTLAAAAAAFLFVAPVLAQSPAALPDRPIARSEVIGVVKKQFAAMDANHDGIVTRAEFETYHAAQAPGAGGPFGHVGGHWFDHADTKGDGRVTLAEAEAHPLQMFDMADTNHDGVVDLQERKLATMMMSLTGK